jgi:hypothetical protein
MRLPSHLADQLSRVPKSSDGYCEYAPCRVTLRSGDVLDRVYIVERAAFRRMWRETEATVLVDDIDRIEDSPVRLPVRWANVLYEAGESGMGYTLFTALLRDATTLTSWSGTQSTSRTGPPVPDQQM